MTAIDYASLKHRETGCSYNMNNDTIKLPYDVHLAGVEAVCDRYLSRYYPDSAQDKLRVYIRQAVSLHDVMEDCRVNYNEIKGYFGDVVADIVFAVTNETGKNRKERAIKTYPKIRENKEAIFVKLCDRIANTTFSLYSGSGMYEKYQKEYNEFEKHLRIEDQFYSMWQELYTISYIRLKENL